MSWEEVIVGMAHGSPRDGGTGLHLVDDDDGKALHALLSKVL